ncbi:MAG TPA: GNAT family N-acetyltransferase [Lentimicrobium sp.]|nr:GNAT family N-acetyltransferase [Lentimicrobium sp.]
MLKAFDNPYPEIVTLRLLLNRFDPEDAASVQKLAGDEAVASNTLAMPFPYADGMAEAWIDTHEPGFRGGQSVIFAIRIRESAEVIGAIGLSLQLQYSLAEVGYWIGAPFWNRGYCTEALEAVLQYAFRELGVHKVMATHFACNPASGRVMIKAGMHREALLSKHMMHWGTFKDLVYYGIFNPEAGSR